MSKNPQARKILSLIILGIIFLVIIIGAGGIYLLNQSNNRDNQQALPTRTPPLFLVTHTDASHLLNRSWSGTFYQTRPVIANNRYPMIFRVETVQGQRFTGMLQWSTFNSTITNVHGTVVTNFGDAREQDRWGQIDDFRFGKEGTWLKFYEISYRMGNGTILDGWYYAFLSDDGIMNGVYFLPDNNLYSGKLGGSYRLT